MTVATLIKALQELPPNLSVRVVARLVYLDACEESFGGGLLQIPDDQSGDVEDVVNLGPFVLIRGL